jgi:uncharacterized membrane protein
MSGLTPLGTLHTAISLIALVAAVASLIRMKEISSRDTLGRIYIFTTVLTCLTGFGIFQHGGFGKPHVLGIVTLVVLAIAWTAEHTVLFGRAARYVSTVLYSLTLFFHCIPASTETLTRLPAGSPVLASAEAPELQILAAVFFVLFIIGAVLQVRRLRGAAAPMIPGAQTFP